MSTTRRVQKVDAPTFMMGIIFQLVGVFSFIFLVQFWPLWGTSLSLGTIAMLSSGVRKPLLFLLALAPFLVIGLAVFLFNILQS